MNLEDPSGADPPGKGVNKVGSKEWKEWQARLHRYWHTRAYRRWLQRYWIRRTAAEYRARALAAQQAEKERHVNQTTHLSQNQRFGSIFGGAVVYSGGQAQCSAGLAMMRAGASEFVVGAMGTAEIPPAGVAVAAQGAALAAVGAGTYSLGEFVKTTGAEVIRNGVTGHDEPIAPERLGSAIKSGDYRAAALAFAPAPIDLLEEYWR